MPCSYHLVGASNLKGSSLGKESLGEGVKFPELDCGRLGLALLLDRRLPQLVSFGLHLRNQDSATGINSSVKSGEKGGDVLLSGAAVILDLVDGAIQGGDGLLCLLFSLGHGDSIAGNLVLKWAGHFVQEANVMAFVTCQDTPSTNGFRASLAVGVDFITNVLLAAGNPLHSGISGKGVLKGNLLVSC